MAMAVTFVLPGAMAIAVIVGLLSGGLRLGAAGQILTGPEVPRAASAIAPKHASRPDHLPTVPAAPAPRLFGPAAVAAPTAGTPAGPVTRPLGTAPQQRPSTGGAPTTAGAAAPATQPSSSPPPSSPPRNPIRELGTGAADTAGQLPPPAGQAGHDAITTVVELVPPALDKTLHQLNR